MSRRGLLMLPLAILCLASTSPAIEVRYTAPMQGVLASDNGVPVADGQYPVSFGIWTDSTGGTMIWSETQVVTVTGGNGLFSTQLDLQPLGGGITVHADADLFLQISVGGQVLTPRQRLGFAMRSMVSSSVFNVKTGDGSVLMLVGDDTTSIKTTREGSGTLIESSINLVDDRYLLGLRAYEPGGTGSSSMTVGTVDSVGEIHGIDLDGDGLFEGSTWEKVDNTGSVTEASSSVSVDSDGDGVAEAGILCQAVLEDVTAGAASGTATLPILPKSTLKTFFQAGSMPSSEITQTVDRSGPVLLATSHQDVDGNGSVDRVALTPESAVVLTETSGQSGSSSSSMRTRIDALETILKSLGLLETSRIQQSLSPESAVVTTEVSDASGSSSSHMRTRINDLEAKLQSIGFLARSASTQSTTPESSSIKIETQLTGALGLNSASAHSDVNGAQWSVESGPNNIGLYVADVVGQCDLIMTTGSSLGTPETTMVMKGATKRFGIGVSEPQAAIHHSSGAQLTDAGDFINASDANLKENFQTVDGAQILKQLERLPIRRWNYKLEADEITHIGPTAQDFKAAFHLGADDRSISTIDPSGVALAAIQELNRKLESENQSLRRDLNELRRQVEKLAATK